MELKILCSQGKALKTQRKLSQNCLHMTKGHLEWQDRLGSLGKLLNNSNSDGAAHFLKSTYHQTSTHHQTSCWSTCYYDSWPYIQFHHENMSIILSFLCIKETCAQLLASWNEF